MSKSFHNWALNIHHLAYALFTLVRMLVDTGGTGHMNSPSAHISDQDSMLDAQIDAAAAAGECSLAVCLYGVLFG